MSYVDRDTGGNIVGLYACAQYPGQEFVESAELYVPPPPAIEQIRAIERSPTVADAMARASRLVAMGYALDEFVRAAALRGQTVTREQAHAWAMANDSNYKTLFDAEQLIRPMRARV